MELRTEIEIAAPPDRVWRALVDFPRFADWNPFIIALSGEARVAARLVVTLGFPDGTEQRVRPEIVVLHPPRELRWRSRHWLPGALCTEHGWLLREIAPNATRFTQGNQTSGWATRYPGNRLTDVARGMVAMNEALKRYVEGEGREPGSR